MVEGKQRVFSNDTSGIEESAISSNVKRDCRVNRTVRDIIFVGTIFLLVVENGCNPKERRSPEGYAFVDGMYLDSPYAVTQEGFVVCINGVTVASTRYTPPVLSGPTEDVSLPGSINESSTSHDATVRDYLGKKMTFFYSRNYPREEIIRRMAQVYRELPCVENVEIDTDPEVFIITWLGEEPIRTRSFGPPGGGRLSNEGVQRMIKLAGEVQKHFESELSRGVCYFFFNQNGYIKIEPERVPKLLPKIVRILNSKQTKEEKVNELLKVGLREIEVPEFQKLITNFESSEQLEQRMKRMK